MNNISVINKLPYKVAYNLISGLLIIFIPVLSHTSGFPIYVLEPMRILVLLYFIISNDKNKYLLAIGLPLLSFLLTGHPILYKLPLVAFDLSLNLVLLSVFQHYKMNLYLSMGLSILISKISYYVLKYLFINAHLLDGNLIDTNIFWQAVNIIVVLIVVFLYSLIKKNG